MKIDGGCHCGHLAFEAEVDPERVSICHCADCQMLGGSAFRIPMIGHVAPEAAVGGAIALIEDGDIIAMDAENRLLELRVSDDELKSRRARWVPPKPNYERGVLAKYAKLVSSASVGAVTS